MPAPSSTVRPRASARICGGGRAVPPPRCRPSTGHRRRRRGGRRSRRKHGGRCPYPTRYSGRSERLRVSRSSLDRGPRGRPSSAPSSARRAASGRRRRARLGARRRRAARSPRSAPGRRARRRGMPDRGAWPSGIPGTSRPLTPSVTTSFIGGLSLVITGTPERRRLEQVEPEALPAARRQAGVGGGEHPQVLVGRQVGGDHLDAAVAAPESRAAADHPRHLLRLPLHLRLEDQPQPWVRRGAERLDRLGERLPLRHEAARERGDDRLLVPAETSSARELRCASGFRRLSSGRLSQSRPARGSSPSGRGGCRSRARRSGRCSEAVSE